MDLLILGNELFYILLYLNFYLAGNFALGTWNTNLWQLTIICLPIYLLKQATNVLQLQNAAREMARINLIDSTQSDRATDKSSEVNQS